MNALHHLHTLLTFAQVDASAPVEGAATPLRHSFEWGRIQVESDWLLPLGIAAGLMLFAGAMIRRDARELGRAATAVLTGLRLTTYLGLLLVYLQPQWAGERDVITNSRVVLLVDTSLSMGLGDADGTPDAAQPTRAQQVASSLAEGTLLDQLRRTHDVSVLGFDSSLRRIATLGRYPRVDPAAAQQPPAPPPTPPAIDWATELTPRGLETRLSQALRQVLHEEAAAPLSGIVLISDGRQNAGLEPAASLQAAREAETMILPIGLGSDRLPTNVRLHDLIAPARAYPGDSFPVTAFVQAQGLAGRTVTVELYSLDAAAAQDLGAAGLLEGSQEVTLGADGEMLPVKFLIIPAQTGRRTLRARVKPPAGDGNPVDDQQEADLEIVDRKTRVLLLAGGPSRDYQFLRNQLRRDKDMLVDVLLQSATSGVSQDAQQILEAFPSSREELFAYDAIVAFDPDWRLLDPNQQELLERWVAEQAGGLLVAAGPVLTESWAQDRAMDRIRSLYPVEFPSHFSLADPSDFGAKEPWPLEFTADGKAAEFLWIEDSGPLSGAAWERFRGVHGHYSVRGPKPAAIVYARFAGPDPAGGSEKPVYLAGHFYGSGRVFYLGSSEVWRLRSENEAYFERFYTKLIRHVSQGRLLRGSNRGVLLVERDRYLLGSNVVVRAQLSDAQLEPLALPRVPLAITLPDGSSLDTPMAADPARAGSYVGQFTVRLEGAYRLDLSIPDSDEEVLSKRLQVRLPDLERERAERNDALLGELATQTGGSYYLGMKAAIQGREGTPPLAQRLRDRSRTVTLATPPVRMWDQSWVMLGLTALLCVEWLLRRLLRLA